MRSDTFVVSLKFLRIVIIVVFIMRKDLENSSVDRDFFVFMRNLNVRNYTECT